MPTSYSGVDTAPTLPLDLPNDGEAINHASLMKDAAAGKGIIGKLIDWCLYLYNRAPKITGNVVTDGAGNVAVTASRGGFTAAISGNYVRITFDTAKANANYAVLMTPGSAVFPAWVLPTTAKVDLSLSNTVGELNLGTTAATIHFAIIDLV